MSWHGTYPRELPKPAHVARFGCVPCRMTIGLLPDFYASRMPGLLDEIYYEIDRANGVVMILSVWGVPKGEGPKL